MAGLSLKSAAKELDGMFGKNFSKKNPDVLVRFFHAKTIEVAAIRISESLESFSTKMELSSIRSGRGMSGMGMDLGMPELGSGMGYMNDLMSEDFNEDTGFENEDSENDESSDEK